MDISTLTDDEVWRKFLSLAADERTVVADLVACIAEVERRRLPKIPRWPSLFEYCVSTLRWSESAAFRRIRAGRAVRKFPIILEMLRDGRLHLEGIVILHAFIDDADFPSLLLKAVGRTTRGIEELVADRRTAPPKRDSIRCVGVAPISPAPATPQPSLALPAAPGEELDAAAYTGGPYRVAVQPKDIISQTEELPDAPRDFPARVEAVAVVGSAAPPAALTPKIYRVGVTVDEELRLMIQRARQLMRHKYPDGSLEGIIRDALKLLIAKKDLGVRAQLAAKRRAARARREAG